MKAEISEMRRLRAEGKSYVKIAKELGVAPSTVEYHMNPETRKRMKKWKNDWRKTHRKEEKMKNREWRKENKEKYRRSMALSIIRWALKNSYINEDDVKGVMMEFKR